MRSAMNGNFSYGVLSAENSRTVPEHSASRCLSLIGNAAVINCSCVRSPLDNKLLKCF